MWREKKAEESLKNSVLDEESAARFSTAAAQAAGRHAKVSNAAQAGLMAARETSPDIVSTPCAPHSTHSSPFVDMFITSPVQRIYLTVS